MAILFGDVKTDIGYVVAGGVGGADPRVLTRTNAAMRALMDDVPQGIFVGSVVQALVTITPAVPGTSAAKFDLPPSMDVAMVFEPQGTTTPMDGWYDIITPSTFVDPDDIMDTVLIDLGNVGAGGARSYAVPELPAGITQATITGLRKFVPVAADTDVLFVQNTRAIKRMVLALDKSERYDQRDEGEGYRKEAVQFLVNELDRALTDPQRFNVRLAQWRIDEHTYGTGTLGNTYAKIALDMRAGQRIGRFKIQRLVFRALGWIYQRIYEYQLIERNRVKGAVPTLTIVPSSPSALVATSSDPSIPIQHEIIRQVVQAFIAEDRQALGEDRAGGRQQPGAEPAISQKLFQEAGTTLMRVLDAQLELLRHGTYAAALDTIIAAGQTNTRGYVAAKWALETEGGLKYSGVEVNRLVNESVREAVNYYNDLGKRDRYSNANGPNMLTWVNAATDASTLVYADYQVLNKLMLAQLPGVSGDTADRYRASAQADIERNLAAIVDATRSTARYGRLPSGVTTLGHITARFGLEVPDAAAALTFSDNQFRRWVNEAAREAVAQVNFLGRTERYSNVSGPFVTTFVYAGSDAAVVSYPDMEVLRRLVMAQMIAEPETARGLRTDAFALIERNLQRDIEAARNTQAQALISGNPDPQFGGMVAKCLLEIVVVGESGQDGYRWSVAEAGRLVRQVWAQLVDELNSQSRQEDYEQTVMPQPPAAPANSVVVPFPFELVKLGVEALACQDRNQEQRSNAYKGAALAFVQRNLVAVVERTRRTTWEALLVSAPWPQFGGTVASIGLEFSGSYQFSAAKMNRWVSQAWASAASHYNFLSRTEDYAQTPVALPAPVTSSSVIEPFSFEVIKLLTESLMAQDAKDSERAATLKTAAFDTIQRDLVQSVEFARRQQCIAQSQLSPESFGYAVGRLGIDLIGGLGMSDAKRRRLANQAEEMLANSGRWKNFEAQYLLFVAPTDHRVIVPVEIDTIVYSEWCGREVEMRGRKWFYTGIVTRHANGFNGWTGGTSRLPMEFAGRDECGNANYILGGTPCTSGNCDPLPPLRALCRRKWVLKANDNDPLLVTNYPALRMMVQSLLDANSATPDYQGASIKRNIALAELDKELAVETAGQKANVSVHFPGLVGGDSRQRYRSRF